MKTVH